MEFDWFDGGDYGYHNGVGSVGISKLFATQDVCFFKIELLDRGYSQPRNLHDSCAYNLSHFMLVDENLYFGISVPHMTANMTPV